MYHVSFRVGHDLCKHAGHWDRLRAIAAQLMHTPLFVPFQIGYGNADLLHIFPLGGKTKWWLLHVRKRETFFVLESPFQYLW